MYDTLEAQKDRFEILTRDLEELSKESDNVATSFIDATAAFNKATATINTEALSKTFKKLEELATKDPNKGDPNGVGEPAEEEGEGG